MEMALDFFRQLRAEHPQVKLQPVYNVALVKFLLERNESQEAIKLTSESVQELDENSSPGLLLELAALTLKLDPSLAETVVDLCEKHPEIQSAQKIMLKEKLTKLRKESDFTNNPS